MADPPGALIAPTAGWNGAGRGTPILEVTDAVVAFGGVRALDGVSLSLERGRSYGVIGPNGAGKTTLFDAISGFTSVNKGSISFDGVDVTAASVLARARSGISRTYQRQQVFGGLSVEDNVLVALEWKGGGGGAWGDLVAAPGRKGRERLRREHAGFVLELCGLSDVRDVPADTLPIGRARTVEVARAIVGSPRLLMLDEPTSGMEAAEVDRLDSVLEWVRDELRCAVLLIEHDVSFVMSHCERVTVLVLGTVLAEGSPSEVQSSEAVRQAYLG